MSDAHDVIRRFIEDVYGAGKVELIDELVHEDYTEHTMMEAFPGNREGLKSFVQVLHGGLSDVDGKVERVLVDNDRVAWRWRMTATHSGDVMGIPPSGNHIEITGNDVGTMRDGKLAERWCEQDMLSLMTQLGAIDASKSQT